MLHSDYGVCSQSLFIQTGMVDDHLLDIGLRPLRLMVREVCVQFFKGTHTPLAQNPICYKQLRPCPLTLYPQCPMVGLTDGQ